MTRPYYNKKLPIYFSDEQLKTILIAIDSYEQVIEPKEHEKVLKEIVKKCLKELSDRK